MTELDPASSGDAEEADAREASRNSEVPGADVPLPEASRNDEELEGGTEESSSAPAADDNFESTDVAPRLPALNEFTPDQLGGPEALLFLLELVARSTDRAEIVEAIRQEWFLNSAKKQEDPEDQLRQQMTRARNVIAGMRQAGLLGPSLVNIELSELGQAILALKEQPPHAYAEFVRFLLKNRRGIEVLEVARALKKRDGIVTKKAVDQELIRRGYALPTNSSYSGKLRQWLAVADVVDANWGINEDRFVELAGVSADDITEWRLLSPAQQAVVVALCVRAIGNTTPIPSPELLELLRQGGVDFDPAQVAKTIYGPLVAKGWIHQEVKKGGRGGKGGLISPTEKALALDLELVEGLELGDFPPELQKQLGTPLSDVLAMLDSEDKHVKGIGLELLALRLATEAGLLPVELRQRGVETGGAEVDLVAEGAHLHFSRWLFQCKNQKSAVGLDVLAKELGMATLLRAQVVAIVTTGPFAKSVLDYARRASETTAIQVILLDGEFLKNYRAKGAIALRTELHNRAVTALTLKRPQLREMPRT
ncbi:restriction endonuclease [Naasia sp. SYSU D00057]|uniref:restriction endonuclease n=1 Tax=Naasia sp. SYSU D00057 TaxID=2817380 RepID=UPI001B310294|nr:restriction endonuclease [Naasia sp. SYSU D00057]